MVTWYAVGHGLTQCLAQPCHLPVSLLAFQTSCGLEPSWQASGLASVPKLLLMFLSSLQWMILAFIDPGCPVPQAS